MIGDLKEARERAKVLAKDDPIEWGRYLVVDEALQDAGEPPISEFWAASYLDFWRSGKTTMCAGKGQRGQGSTTCLRAALIPEVLVGDYKMASVSQPVIPIVSCDDNEASNRITDIKNFLKKLSLTELPKRPKSAEKIGVGPLQFVELGTSDIHLLDCDGNPTKFSVTTRSVGGVSGFTGRSALCDEVDLWDARAKIAGDKPVAESVIQILTGRGFGEASARMYMLSRLFDPEGPLSTRIASGNNEERYIVVQGELGAARDVRARAWLKRHCEELAMLERDQGNARHARENEMHAEDPRLVEPGNPDSGELPTWVCAAGDPEKIMAECWRRAVAASKTGDNVLDELFGPYGSRARAGAWGWISAALIERAPTVPNPCKRISI
jgi:hypothetical protein